jgi:ATP-dependent RNA helicase DeaD
MSDLTGRYMTNFQQLGLPSELVTALERMQITLPTPIQIAAIPPALAGLDILASAQTGTGKTVAYAIPLIIQLLKAPGSRALILAPTRELALQVETTLIQILGKASRFKTALLIGGAPMGKQMHQLKGQPQVVIGTPGRIYDHLQRKTLVLSKTNFFIIDEADRMLDMGFQEQLDNIAKFLPTERQTLMFSATIPHAIEKLTAKYLNNPERIAIGSQVLPAPKIKQEEIHTSGREKMSHLLKELDAREGTVLVFVKTRRGADRMSRDLREKGHAAEAIHGDLPQRKRDGVIAAFRNKRTRILVATDIAARGLDIPHLMHVINYDLPQCPEDFIHRIGRTGRAGQEGSALCLISPDDTKKWRAICHLMNPQKHSRGASSEPTTRSQFNQKKSFFKKSRDNRSFGSGSSSGNYAGKSSESRSENYSRKPSGGYAGKSSVSRSGKYSGKPSGNYAGKSSESRSESYSRKPSGNYAGKSSVSHSGKYSGKRPYKHA